MRGEDGVALLAVRLGHLSAERRETAGTAGGGTLLALLLFTASLEACSPCFFAVRFCGDDFR